MPAGGRTAPISPQPGPSFSDPLLKGNTMKSWLKRSVLMLVLLSLAGVAHAWDIEPVSSPVFYIDTGINPPLKGMYVAYRVRNDGPEQADVWVTITNFTGGVVSRAPSEDGAVRLGRMRTGDVKLACFYLQASGETLVAQGHTVHVHTSPPSGGSVYNESFSFTKVQETIKAQANKVNVVVTTPNPPTLGGLVTITVDGHTGTIGADRVLAYTPATYLNWRPDALQLANTELTLSGGNNGVFNDTLFLTATDTPDTAYKMVYTFRIVALTGITVPVSPVGFISSGTQIKHTDTGGFVDILPVEPVVNETTLTKTANTNFVAATGSLTFSIQISNASLSNNVTLTDIIDTLPTSPGSVAYIAGSSAFNGAGIADPTTNGATLRWDGPFEVPFGQTRSLTFNARFAGVLGSYTNSAVGHVDTTQIDTTIATDNAPATKVVQVYPVADLVVVKTGATNVQAGAQLIYTISVTNNGPSVATNVVVTDTLPAGAVFTGASGGGTTNLSGQVIWPSIASLASNAVVSYTVTNLAAPFGIMTNSVAVSSDIAELLPGDNTATAISSVTTVSDLTIIKTPSFSPVFASTNFAYTLTIVNNGPSPATSLVVTDSLPSNLTYLGAIPDATLVDSNTVVWSLPAGLPASGTTNLTLFVRAPDSGTITNTASAYSDSLDPTPAVTNNIVSVSPWADITVSKSSSVSPVSATNEFYYSILVSNIGPVATTSLVVTDSLPATVRITNVVPPADSTNGNHVVWNLPVALAPNQATNLLLYVQAPAEGALTNVVTAGSDLPDPSPATFTHTLDVTAFADLVVVKTGATNVNAGAILSYSISVTNNGPSLATGIQVTDQLPENITVHQISGNGTVDGNTITWPAFSLGSQAYSNFTVEIIAPTDDRTLTNRAWASSPTVTDQAGGNNTGTVVSAVTPVANLLAIKSAITATNVGAEFDYTLTVTNLGPSAAISMVVTDIVPQGVTVLNAPGNTSPATGVLVWNNFTLPANMGTNLTVTVRADEERILTNQMFVGSGTLDDQPGNNSSNAVTVVSALADLLAVSAGPTTTNAGVQFDYSLLVTNLGPNDAVSMVVTDIVQGASVISAPGSANPSPGVYVWSGFNLPAFGGTNLLVTVLAPSNPGVISNLLFAGSAVFDNVLANNATNSVTTIGAAADLVAIKTGPVTTNASAQFDYTLTVTNLGPSTAVSMVVTDIVPQGVTVVAAPGSSNATENVLVWQGFDLPANASTNFSVTVLATNEACVVTNQMFAGSSVVDYQTGNNSSNAVTTVGALANLLAISTGPASTNAGAAVEYSLLVSNLGPSTATSMVITDIVPAGVTVLAAPGSDNPAPGVYVWSGFSLPAFTGTNLLVRIETPILGGVLTNQLIAGSAVFDDVLANNVSNAVTTATFQGVTVAGFVYLDSNNSTNRNEGEGGPGVPVFVKITGVVTNYAEVDVKTGAYALPDLPPGTYDVFVSTNSSLTDLTPSAPAGWYGTEVPTLLRTINTAELPDNLNFGLFAPPSSGLPLFVEKTASRREAEIGDPIVYSVQIRNVSGNAVAGITLEDVLPAGFAYQRGSAQLDKAPLADPAGGKGPRLTFTIGTIQPGATVTLAYRVLVGVGALEGTGKNRARASAPGTAGSNTSIAFVKVVAGVFTDKAILIGKVFVDQNQNKVQDDGEPGVPGVRLYIEDGTFVVTDSEGKYNIYGLSPRTHVVKVDETTLPAGAVLEQLTPRHDKRGATCLADVRNGELRKVNFGILPAKSVSDEVEQRRQRGEVNVAEIQQSIRREMISTPLPQAGTTKPVTPAPAPAAPAAAFQSLMTEPQPLNGDTSNLPERPVARTVTASQLGQIKITLPAGDQPADGLTPATVRVAIVDSDGRPVTAQTRVTIESSLGRWQVEDIDGREPGIQTLVEKGAAEFVMLPPQEPGDAQIVVSSGQMQARAVLPFIPALRPLMAVGVIEGRLNLHSLDLKNMLVARQSDGFEQELRNWAFTSGSGHTDGGARAALFLKGKVKGDYLLTLAYDSDKETQQRLFRDIEPDKYYPVYGDSSVRGFDAQSTSRLYVRVDKKRCYVLYGDYTTTPTSPAQGLGAYSRSLTGVRGHYEKSNIVLNAWAAYDTTRQVVREFRADGTSGPYFFSSTGILENSEKVEIITRDRNQTSVILKTVQLARFSDYEFEPFASRLLFRAPVPSLDENLNPISIRVTFETDQGGDRFWVYGADGQIKLLPRWEVGGTVARDEAPGAGYELYSGNTTLKLTDRTYLLAELAQSHSVTNGTGSGGRVELRHDGRDYGVRIWGAYVEERFTNPSANISAGRQEIGASGWKELTEKTRLVAQAIDTRELANDGERWGFTAGLEHTFDSRIRLELGGRYSHESVEPASATTVGVAPNEVISARAKVTAPVPNVKRASVYGEAENDLVHTGRRMLAVGANYQVEERTRMYARHEFINALGGPYELNGEQEQNTTVFGVDTEYMRDGHVFNEYRMRDAINGRDAEAAIGLRNGWYPAEGLRLLTSFERVTPILGSNVMNRITAIALGFEYLAPSDWKASGRLELRHDEDSNRWLNTLGYARKLNRDWTLLAKSIVLAEENEGSEDRFESRLQLGVAWRQTRTDVWNGLFLYEYKYEENELGAPDLLDRHVHTLSAHVNYHPLPKWTLSGRYAMKLAENDATGDYYLAHLVGGRLMYDITDRWSAGLNGSVMFNSTFSSTQYGFGPDIGFRVHDNLWLDVGYNLIGFHDNDLAGANYTDHGFWFGMRMQFDEHILDGFKAKK